MTETSNAPKLSLFQSKALELLIEVCNLNRVGEFHSVFGFPYTWGDTDYGNTIKIKLPNQDVTLWLYVEEFQIMKNDDDEYGCTDELIDTIDSGKKFEDFMKLFLEKILIAFNFSNRPS